jgi:hypothetical protein
MLLITAVLLMVLAAQGAAVEPTPQLTAEAAEAFLRRAEVVELEEYENKGITHPRRAILSDGEVTLRAVFKDVDTFDQKWKSASGVVYLHVTDSYKHEIASYELDRLLGLGVVPPTVERRIGRQVGSLQLWIEGAMTEWERKKVKKLSPPDMVAWNNQVSIVKLFLQLIWDTDYNNVSNLMVDEDWKIWKVDASRAFYPRGKLRREESLTRFSRVFLSALKALDRQALDTRLGPWLSRREINTLWQRRGRILELARERVEEFGEAAVLYD